jgi:L-seryl-tRNA(Ser) seleniumtransferase
MALNQTGQSATQLESALRTGTPPVIVRIDKDRVVIDLRTVMPEDDPGLLAAVRGAVRRTASG